MLVIKRAWEEVIMNNHTKKKRPTKKQPAWHSNHSIKEPEDHYKQYVEDEKRSRSDADIDGDESVHKISEPMMHLIIW